MSETFTDGGVAVTVDAEATRRLYTAKAGGEADRCACKFCRNFVPQRATAYPAHFIALLDRLGIDPSKENEPIGFALPESASQAFYQVSFDFAGAIGRDLPPSIDTTRGAFTFRYKSGADYTRGQQLADATGVGPIASIHATLWLPWTLAETLLGPGDAPIASQTSVRGLSYGLLLGRLALTCVTYIRSLLGARPD